MAGVFITKGMSITIPIGTDFASGSIAIQAHFDVCPTWLKLSLGHLRDAKKRRDDRQIAWQGNDDALKASTLEREFEASMQAIMSAAIGIDAFYAVVRDKAPSVPAKRANGRGPSRSAQVSEAIKNAFQLKPKGFAILRDCAKKSTTCGTSQFTRKGARATLSPTRSSRASASNGGSFTTGMNMHLAWCAPQLACLTTWLAMESLRLRRSRNIVRCSAHRRRYFSAMKSF
jgi:hypothetical protein